MFANSPSLAAAGEVLSIFLIPFGGGIPAGVVLAKNRGLTWPIMLGLYFVSDIILALIFEPLLLGFTHLAKKYPFFARVRENYRAIMKRLNPEMPPSPAPFALIMISFGIDPMTGRAAALAAGHGFITGWLIAIFGDMIFFAVLMASTLWLDNILGDGTMAAVIIMVAMVVVPWLIKRIRQSGLLRRS